jgi:hypothetical protein
MAAAQQPQERGKPSSQGGVADNESFPAIRRPAERPPDMQSIANGSYSGYRGCP